MKYRWYLEKKEGCGLMAHERLTEQRVTMEWLVPKRNSLSDLPAFLGPYGRSKEDFQIHQISFE